MDARQRSGSAAAATAFERAASFSITDEQRSRRLFEAAIDYDLAGQLDRAISLLGEALSNTVDPLVRADIHNLRGRLESWRRPTQETQRLCSRRRSASRLPILRGRRSCSSNATTPSFLLGDTAQALAIAERAYAVGERVGGTDGDACRPPACLRADPARRDSRRARELLTECSTLGGPGRRVHGRAAGRAIDAVPGMGGGLRDSRQGRPTRGGRRAQVERSGCSAAGARLPLRARFPARPLVGGLRARHRGAPPGTRSRFRHRAGLQPHLSRADRRCPGSGGRLQGSRGGGTARFSPTAGSPRR